MAKFFIIFTLVAVNIALAAAADDAVNDPNDVGTGDKPRRGFGYGGGVGRNYGGYSSQHYGQYAGVGQGYFGGVGVPAYGVGGGHGYNNIAGYNSLGYSAYPGIGQVGLGYPAYTAGLHHQPIGVGAVGGVPVGVGYALH